MKLSKAVKGKQYIVSKILTDNEDLISRFYKIGIIPGAELELRQKAPLFGDPLLFQVGNSQIALTKSEASLLESNLEEK